MHLTHRNRFSLLTRASPKFAPLRSPLSSGEGLGASAMYGIVFEIRFRGLFKTSLPHLRQGRMLFSDSKRNTR